MKDKTIFGENYKIKNLDEISEETLKKSTRISD